MSSGRFKLLVLVGSLCAGCATTRLAPEIPVGQVEEYAHYQEKGGLAVAMESLSDSAELREYFGDDLLEKDLLPILVVAQNKSSEETYLISAEGVSIDSGPDQGGDTNASEKVASSVEARDAAYEKDYGGIRAAIVSPILLPVAFVDWGPSEHSKSVQHNIVSKALGRKSLSPGQSHAGCVYLRLPPGQSDGKATHMVLVAERLMGGEPLRFSIPVTIPVDAKKKEK
jgi:hypothetical protein